MLYLPKDLPVSQTLQTVTYALHDWHSVAGCERVLLLNLMPQKEVTEMDIARTLQQTGLPLQIIPIKISGQHYKNTSEEHMDRFYLNFEDVALEYFDRLIITGAPLEQIEFEEVRYWDRLCYIMDWADRHVARTLYICWAAQAGLYHFYNIHKHPLENKMFGIFLQQVLVKDHTLMTGLCPDFPMPNSRHTEVQKEEICRKADALLQILAESRESGVGVMATSDLKRTFIVGHLEYAPDTLHNEYWRDMNKGLPILPPEHYYREDKSIDYSWQQAAVIFYHNWLRAE